jgi:hypothetical protein
MGKLSMGLGFVAGYVLGAKAGRGRYEQLRQAATTFAERPEVNRLTQRVTGLATTKIEPRSRANAGLQRARSAASHMRHRRRAGAAEPFEPAAPVPQPPANAVDPLAAPNSMGTEPVGDAARPLDQQ